MDDPPAAPPALLPKPKAMSAAHVPASLNVVEFHESVVCVNEPVQERILVAEIFVVNGNVVVSRATKWAEERIADVPDHTKKLPQG